MIITRGLINIKWGRGCGFMLLTHLQGSWSQDRMVFNTAPIQFSRKNFGNVNVAVLKEYLQKSGISTNYYRTETLVKYVECAEELDSPAKSDTQQQTSAIHLRNKLEEINFPTEDHFRSIFNKMSQNISTIAKSNQWMHILVCTTYIQHFISAAD